MYRHTPFFHEHNGHGDITMIARFCPMYRHKTAKIAQSDSNKIR
jgi:hypothetical protein